MTPLRLAGGRRRRRVATDDPGDAAASSRRRRIDFDPEGASRAGRRPPPPAAGAARPARAAARHRPGRSTCGCRSARRPSSAARRSASRASPGGSTRSRCIPTAAASTPHRPTAASGTPPTAARTWRSLGGFAATDTARDQAAGPPPRLRRDRRRLGGRREADDEVFVGTGETHHFDRDIGRSPASRCGGIGILVGHGPAGVERPPTRGRARRRTWSARGVYRIALQPGGTGVVAATTIGLFQRPAGGGLDVDWTRVAGTPFDDARRRSAPTSCGRPATAPAGPNACGSGSTTATSAGLWVRDDGADQLHATVATPGSLAAARRARGLRRRPTRSTCSTTRPTAPAAAPVPRAAPPARRRRSRTVVAGVPNVLRTPGLLRHRDGRRSRRLPNRVVLGGATFNADRTRTARTLRQTTARSSSPTSPTTRRHADVRPSRRRSRWSASASTPMSTTSVLRNNGNRLWAACDGGVFRIRPARRGQVGFFAAQRRPVGHRVELRGRPPDAARATSSPACRTTASSSAPRAACGGTTGAATAAASSSTRCSPTATSASTSGAAGRLVGRRRDRRCRGDARAAPASRRPSDASAFYSTPAAIAHAAAPRRQPTDVGQILIGTTRVWYTEDFGTTWVTLPTGTDPLAGRPDRRRTPSASRSRCAAGRARTWRGSCGEGRAASATPARPARDAARRAGHVDREPLILRRGVKNKKDEHRRRRPDPRRRRVDRHRRQPRTRRRRRRPAAEQRGTKGAVYLGTIGHPDNDRRRHAVVVRRRRRRGTRPACAASRRRAGTGDGDRLRPGAPRRGVRRHDGRRVAGRRARCTAPTRRLGLAPRVNGLPEAAVEDLASSATAGCACCGRRSPPAACGSCASTSPTSRTSPTCAPTTTTCATAPRAVADEARRRAATARGTAAPTCGRAVASAATAARRPRCRGRRGALPTTTRACAASRPRCARAPATRGSGRPACGTPTSTRCCATSARPCAVAAGGERQHGVHRRRCLRVLEHERDGRPRRPPSRGSTSRRRPPTVRHDLTRTSTAPRSSRRAIAAATSCRLPAGPVQGRRRRPPSRVRQPPGCRRAGHPAALVRPADEEHGPMERRHDVVRSR